MTGYEAFNIALAQFARDVGAGPRKQVILVVDGAGWHTAKDLVIPAGVHFSFLPPYSPELQPAEHLWPLVREEVANKLFMTLDELEDAIITRCCSLQKDPETLHRATLFHWWHGIEDLVA